MSKRFKKISLKIEYLNLELEEVEELAATYLAKFNKEFYDEIAFVKSAQKLQKINPSHVNDSSVPPSPLIQKIYRNLAKILHPDVSQLERAEEEFKRASDCCDNHDLMGLITLSNKHKIDLPELTDEEYIIIETTLKETEKRIKSNQTTLAWMWCNSKEDKEALKQKIYQMINLNQEEFEKWKLEVAGIEPAS